MWKGKRVHVSGIRIFYRDAGSGAPLLLLHGWTGNSFQWRKVFPALAQTFRVIAPDLPGCGLSDKPSIQYTIADHISYLKHFVRAVGLSAFGIVGTSFGGFLASRYCLACPRDVRALVLLNSSGIRARYPWIFKACTIPAVRYLVPLVSMIPRELKLWIRATIFPRTPTHAELLNEFRYSTLTLRSRRGLEATLRTIANITEQDLLDPWLERIECPTLILWGEQDTVLSRDMAGVFHRKIPGSLLRFLPGCGHNIPEERPQEVVREIEAFFRGLAQTTRS